MTRRCSHCSNNGHNSRTCPSRTGGVRLFGVRLTDGSIMKSASMGNLSALYHSSSSVAVSPNPNSPATSDPVEGYLSDDPAHAKRRADRKKGTPWTEDEHRLFLVGLQKLGKGDWRGIARSYVKSRTPTQVASHAQKHFIRQCTATRRKRRSSLFDMPPDPAAEPPEDQFMLPPPAGMDHSHNCSLKLSLKPEPNPDQSMEVAPTEIKMHIKEEPESSSTVTSTDIPPTIPAFYPAYIPIPYPVWTRPEETVHNNESDPSSHRVLKPIPILPKESMNLDKLVRMSSKLSLKDTNDHHHRHRMELSPLSLRLLAEPSRQSAFHASSPVLDALGMNKGSGGEN